MERVHQARLRAAAQLVSILGQQLIDEKAVGLLELVKNSYDADATQVDIKLENLHDPEGTLIVVHDNGTGMDAADVLERWMVAGYSYKADQKLRLQRTPAGRLPLGQMGIGRFATARLGKKLMVVSHKAGKPEVYFEVQWSEFEGGGDVGDVSIQVVEREPKFFRADRTGTRLVMIGSPDPWSEADVRSLHRKLMRLISPVHKVENFSIRLSCPEYPELESLEPAGIINKFHYQLVATVFHDGLSRVRIVDRLKGFDESIDVDLWEKVPRRFRELNGREKPICGPFEFEPALGSSEGLS